MSALNLNTVTPPPSVQATRPVDSPKPPKSQSDHKPVNDATSSRGPAVVLSGALAKPTDKGNKSPSQDGSSQGGSSQGGGQPTQTSNVALGQHVNHVL
ncbi:hypothetical protein [Phenylobacterium sp.]|uniref:hypothetical protein n=1 Tax=Phenylobacterium sp. TaxID=1871053 RepID=UPI001212461A|nr:hypothetical protein [Phenylobacterium sp.]THD67310.1 MAG: hypothetical protein E8A12_05190 [Phenylobacterium sp.]